MVQSAHIASSRTAVSRWKKIALAVAAVALVAIVAAGSGGWYLSDLLKDGGLVPDHDEPEEYTLEVAAIAEGRVTLRRTSETDEDGDWKRGEFWGLEGEAGDYDQVGKVLEATEDQVVREFFPIGDPPSVGEMVRLDSFAYPEDPQKALGLPFEEVHFSSELGEFPAWLIGGPSDTWVIFVHGKGAERREALRILPTIAESELRALIITYRNDEGLPEDPDGFYRYGETEWVELEGAAQYALDNGARRLILVGYSMGGAIVTNFLYRSSLADSVEGAILDAPMLDFSATVDLGASESGYPQLFATFAKAVAGFRFDIDWGELDYLERADELDIQILLFHGDADDTVPQETSNALAESRQDIVRYLVVPGARHVRSWNTDRGAYEAAVREFLRDLAQ